MLLLLFVPLGFLWLNDNWIYNFPGWADQWIYFGNHEGLLRKLKLFADSYRVNRFSWDLPGALCYALLPPLAARLTFHLTFYYAAALSFYAVAKRTLGRRAALLVRFSWKAIRYFSPPWAGIMSMARAKPIFC